MDPQENPAVADIKARQAADRRVSLSPKECQTEGGWGESTYRAKVASGALHRYLDGARVRITAASFYGHQIELASGAPDKKVRQPASRFQKAVRPRTPQELAALQRANAASHEAKQRREAAKVAQV